jgi:hypothetical protein
MSDAFYAYTPSEQPTHNIIENLFIHKYIPGFHFSHEEIKKYFPWFLNIYESRKKIIMIRTESTKILIANEEKPFAVWGDYSIPQKETKLRFSFSIQTFNGKYARKKLKNITIIIDLNTMQVIDLMP